MKQIVNSRSLFTRVGWFFLCTFPVVLFLFPFLFNAHDILPGDWDYFAQLYEAARRSIIEYHQFPWFNAWLAGGIPLYANPQFGLFSIQMPLVLVFGTLVGLRLSVLLYFVLGLWGMRNLLMRLGSDKFIALLLSYIWVFSSFPVWRIAGGHLTFGTYLLAPWFFILLLNVRKPKGWLWLGLFTAFLINQSLHYTTVHILLIGATVALFQLWKNRTKLKLSFKSAISPYLLAAMITLPLAAHKFYFTFQYIHDFPRIPPTETVVPFNIITAALTFRGTNILDPVQFYKGGYGWTEYAAYFGLVTLGLLTYLLVKNLEKIKSIPANTWFLLSGMFLMLLISLGSFSIFSPYSLLKNLPFFDQMQVSPRWLGWFVFGAIIFLAKLPRRKLFVTLLAISVLDVFSSNFGVINQNFGNYSRRNDSSTTLNQQAFYENSDGYSINSLRLFNATQNNVGDIYGYEPLVGFGNERNEGFDGLTNRCVASGSTCSFVITGNAIVEYWSPNYIKLRRTAPGPIELNLNPGSYWKVNGVRAFPMMNVVELRQAFIISDSAESILINADPKLLPSI